MSRVAVLAVDPGGTTGVAWGFFDLGGESVGSILLGGGEVRWGELTGSEQYQAAKILDIYSEIAHLASIEDIDFDFVIEDFVLRPGRASAAREMLSPVRITSLVEGMLIARTVGVDLVGEWERRRTESYRIWKQLPSAAKSFATNERLKRWGVYHKGMRHARDAWRHVALRLATRA